MAQVIVVQRMWQRRDTAANWTSKNPILEAGEIGVQLGASASDPQLFKIGNGVTNWNTLAFAGGAGGSAAWYTGSGAPSSGLGANGDFYIRTSNGDLYQKATGTWSVIMNIKGPPGVDGTNGTDGAPGDPGPAGPPGPASSSFPKAEFFNTNPSADIDDNATCWIYVPFEFEITGFVLSAQPAGTVEIDVRVSTFIGWPAGPGDSICGANRPRLTGGDRLIDTTLTGWGTVVPAGSFVTFVVTNCIGVNRAQLQLIGEREVP